MSTNINNPLEDVVILEKLANELFASYPGEQSTPTQIVAPSSNSIAQQQPGSGGGNHEIPASVAGSGISPSAINQQNAVDLKNPQTSLQDPNNVTSTIPSSVAGSGISPSANARADAFYLSDLQTSLSESYAQGESGRIPPSQGYNFTEVNNKDNVQRYENGNPLESPYLALSEVSPFQLELEKALGSMRTNVPSSQIPYDHSSNVAEYYFSPQFQPTQVPAFGQGINDIGNFPKPPFDLNIIRNDFPILSEIVNGQKLVWLDNAATTQKPRQVIDRLSYFYEHENSNIHRAAHTLAARATDAYEEARNIVRQFINARSTNEIIFVRGTTEGVNLIAQSWGDQYLQEGDEIVISHLEHHANIVPWQFLAKKKGAKLKVIPVDDNGELLIDEYVKLLTPRTKLVSVTAVSNALGTVNPIKKIIDLAHQAGAKVLIDGAQSISHIPTDVQYLDADWFVFSGHKIYGPTGIGVVYGKEEILNATKPWQGGGNMIKDVTFDHTEYHQAPTRFEAGTGNIGDAVGLGAALQYVSQIGIAKIQLYESALIKYATERLRTIPGLHIIGNAHEKAGAISFVLDGFETTKVGGLLSKHGIAVRAGHHCAQPILRRFGQEATVRPSFAFYNTCAEIDTLVNAVKKIQSGQLV